jgi:hypothetical protein
VRLVGCNSNPNIPSRKETNLQRLDEKLRMPGDEHLDAAHPQPNRHALDWNSHAGPGQDFRQRTRLPSNKRQKKAEEVEKVLHQVRAR